MGQSGGWFGTRTAATTDGASQVPSVRTKTEPQGASLRLLSLWLGHVDLTRLDAEAVQEVKSEISSSSCPAAVKLALLESLYYDCLLDDLSLGDFTEYLHWINSARARDRDLPTRGLFLSHLIEDGVLDPERAVGEVSTVLEHDEVTVELLASVAALSRDNWPEASDLWERVRVHRARSQRSSLLWHALFLSELPLANIAAEVTCVPFGSLGTALDDWPIRDNQEQWKAAVELGAVTEVELGLLGEFGSLLDDFLKTYSGELLPQWSSSPRGRAARSKLAELFQGQNQLVFVYKLPEEGESQLQPSPR